MPQPDPGTARSDLVAPALGNRREPVGVADTLERRHRYVGVLRLQRHRQQFVSVVQPRQRAGARGAIAGVTRNAAERLRIADQVDHRRAHVDRRVVAGDQRHFLQASRVGKLARDVGRLHRITGFGADAGQLPGGFVAYVGIWIRLGDLAQGGHVVETRHGGPSYACLRVFARQCAKHVPFVGPEVIDRGRPHCGV